MVTYCIAETTADRSSAQSLIEVVFSERLGLSDIKRDEFDELACFILGKADDTVVAAMRVVADGPAGLPIDAHTDISSLRARTERLAEVGRLVVHEDHRRQLVCPRGVPFLREVATRLGVSHLIVDSLLTTQRLYQRLGFVPWGSPFHDPTAAAPGDEPDRPNAQVLLGEVGVLAGWR